MTDNKKELVEPQDDQQLTGEAKKDARRKVLKNTLVGGAVISTSIMPEKWSKPILDSVVLPGHASTTDGTGSGGPGNTTAAPTKPPQTTPQYTTPPPKTTPPWKNTTANFSFSDWTDKQIS